MKNGRRWTAGGLLLLAAVLLALAAALAFRPAPGPVPTPAPTVEPTPQATPEAALDDPALESPPEPEETAYQTGDVVDGLPVGKWAITQERREYTDGALRLVIPKLAVDIPILGGTDAGTLLKGVGLYDYAQLPGEGNRNVSIAGHRNGLRNGKITDNMPFYYLDTLAEGDYLYLSDKDHIYRYCFESATVVESDDWSPIATTGESCLTLTTCTPIGVSDHRLIIRGCLDEILPAGEAGDLPEKEAGTK